ncbi:MAG: sugar phosphate isomerase/epimerase family protein, partial [Bryobacteraceae bacterium]
MNRRTFLSTFAALPLAAVPSTAAGRLPLRKAVLYSMLPRAMALDDRFRLAVDCGFEEMECPTIEDASEAERIKKAAESAKLRIHSVMNQAHWKFPLSSGDPEVVARSVQGMETSLRNAHLWGADTVLLVPAVVDATTSYRDAWTRSQQQIRRLIPLAKQLKVVIAVEEVWNKFLLSPLEFAAYVDSFKSPWVRAYFDVGNVVINGYPQDWIRVLGKRIVKLHIKDFTFAKREARFVALREGEVDWKEVHRAIAEIG